MTEAVLSLPFEMGGNGGTGDLT